MSFQKGENVVHGGHGLGEVQDIIDFEGTKLLRVSFPGDLTTMVPLEKAGQMLRRPMRIEQAKALLKDVKGAAPDPRHWRHRYRHATRILVEGSVRQRAQLLGSFYALRSTRALSFAEKKIHDDAERSMRTELAFVLERDPEELTTELIKFFSKNPPEPAEPDEMLAMDPEKTISMPKQNGPAIEGWRYLGSFTLQGNLRAGDRNWVLNAKTKKRQGGHPDYKSIKAVAGTWHTYQKDVDGEESLFAFQSKVKKPDPMAADGERGQIWVEGGDLALVDEHHRELPEVADNLRWEMSPAGRCFPWGVLVYTAKGDGVYTIHSDVKKGDAKQIRITV